jgi:hypothetical protein
MNTMLEEAVLIQRERKAATRKLVPLAAMAEVLHTEAGTLVITYKELGTKGLAIKGYATTVRKVKESLPEGFHYAGDVDFSQAVLCNDDERHLAALRKSEIRHRK